MPTSPANPAPVVPSATDQTPEKIRGMFGSIAPTYDLLNRLLSGWLDQRWRARAAREVLSGLSPCAHLLDVATGTGDLAATLSRTARQGSASSPTSNSVQVTGVDFTRPMLVRAARKYGRAGYEWIEADGLRLPLRDGAFDAVTIAFGLRNMADKSAALRELARVIRPGGRVAILEFSQPRNRLFRALYDFYSFTVMPRLGRWLSGSEAYLYLPGSIRSFWGPGELSEQMRRAGLGQVRARALLFGVVYLHVGTKTSGEGGEA